MVLAEAPAARRLPCDVPLSGQGGEALCSCFLGSGTRREAVLDQREGCLGKGIWRVMCVFSVTS
ncbi:hypothetical protein E2C01_006752 [Portunus trituberculatus]|uniref:Uncharacterized protein n=1 Tax=Portunus trituberculatus TaxID=210409 RepID=A0A5B7CX62_PORTR|nr:hypothetical protein [Portunus trituberculatus]